MQAQTPKTILSPGTEQVLSKFLENVELPVAIKSLTFIFNQFLSADHCLENREVSNHAHDFLQILSLLYGLQKIEQDYLITKDGIVKH